MRTSVSRACLALLLALGAAACDSGNVTMPTTGVPVTEAFGGTLTQDVRVTHPFEVPVRGSVTAQIVSIEPTDAAVMGFALGSWDGASCAPILQTTSGQIGSVLAGTAREGNMCVQVFDVGNYDDQTVVTYVVTVVRPAIVTAQ